MPHHRRTLFYFCFVVVRFVSSNQGTRLTRISSDFVRNFWIFSHNIVSAEFINFEIFMKSIVEKIANFMQWIIYREFSLNGFGIWNQGKNASRDKIRAASRAKTLKMIIVIVIIIEDNAAPCNNNIVRLLHRCFQGEVRLAVEQEAGGKATKSSALCCLGVGVLVQKVMQKTSLWAAMINRDDKNPSL